MKLYHSTAYENVFFIIEEGLKVDKSRDYSIYFGEDDYTAACFQFLSGINDFFILEFTIPKNKFKIQLSADHNANLLKQIFPRIKKCYYSTMDIPPEYITKIIGHQDGQIFICDKEEWQ